MKSDMDTLEEHNKTLEKHLNGIREELVQARKELADTRDQLVRFKRSAIQIISKRYSCQSIQPEQKQPTTFPLAGGIINKFDALKHDTRIDFFELLDDNIDDEIMDRHEKHKFVKELFITSASETHKVVETIRHNFCKSLFIDELTPNASSFLEDFLQANYENRKLFDPTKLAKNIANSQICNVVLQILVKDYFRGEFVGFLEKCLFLCWTMELYSRPLFLGEENDFNFDECKHQRTFDAGNGDQIAYFVWPSLEGQDHVLKKALVFVCAGG